MKRRLKSQQAIYNSQNTFDLGHTFIYCPDIKKLFNSEYFSREVYDKYNKDGRPLLELYPITTLSGVYVCEYFGTAINIPEWMLESDTEKKIELINHNLKRIKK